MRRFALVGLLLLTVRRTEAQSRPEPPLLRARRVERNLALKVFNGSGSIRLEGWDHDSIAVRGRVSRRDRLIFTGDSASMKLVVEERSPDEHAHPADIIVYLPRQSSVSVKTVDAVVTAANVGGWFYSVSGAVRLSGATANAEAESMSGDIELALTTPWAKARTGRGHLMVRGSPQDVDASTISGALDIDAPSIAHGRFASVTGDIRYTASVKRDAVFEFSNHAGDVDFVLQRAASAAFDLSTVTGAIENAFTQVRPVATTPRSLRLRLGGGEAQIVVRTFKGTIRLRPR